MCGICASFENAYLIELNRLFLADLKAYFCKVTKRLFGVRFFAFVVGWSFKLENRVCGIKRAVVCNLYRIFIYPAFTDIRVGKTVTEFKYGCAREIFVGSVFHTVISEWGQVTVAFVEGYRESCARGYLSEKNIGKCVAARSIREIKVNSLFGQKEETMSIFLHKNGRGTMICTPSALLIFTCNNKL